MNTLRAQLVLVACALSSLSCDGAEPMMMMTPEEFDRRAMLESLVDVVILPTYRDFVEDAEALERSAETFCAAPDQAGLDAVQDAWWEARGQWKRADAFALGPYRETPLRLGPKIDFWPVREANIEEAVAGTEPIDQAYLDARGVTVKGLPALEYLLFDPEGGDAAVLDAFVAAPRRCEYAVALSADLILRGEEMVGAWDPESGDYRSMLVDAGEGSLDFHMLHDAVSEVMNRFVFCIEDIRELKLGRPLGHRSGGEPRPLSVESRYADRSVADMLDDLAGVEAMYTGDYGGENGIGYQDFLLARRPELDPDVLDHLDEARRLLSAIEEPLRVAVVDDPSTVDVAYEAVKGVHLIFGVEVAQALGITITFNDTDGD